MYCTVHITLHLWILLHLLTFMNYIKWSMICTVQYMDLNLPVNSDELHQMEYDIYCAIHGNRWSKIHVLYSTYHTPPVVIHQF
jgi:hypothetical protein